MSTKSVSNSKNLTIVVIGASGDLSLKKIFPAFYTLFQQKLIPENFHIVGFSRTNMDDEAFRERIKNFLPESNSAAMIDNFLKRCYYCQGNYSEIQDYAKMGDLIQKLEAGNLSSKIYYLAIPPFLFLTVSDALAHSNLIHAQEEKGICTRVVVEKPFGKDRESSDELTEIGRAHV